MTDNQNGHPNGRPLPEPPALTTSYPKDTPARVAARLLIESGATQADAAKAAEVHDSTITAWVQEWVAAGWKRPPLVQPRVETGPARQVAQQRWIDHRERVGTTAGLLAAMALQRVSELLPLAGNAQTIVEQASVTTAEGKQVPVGVPRHRVIVPVPSIEVYRLSEAAKTLFALADRANGLGTAIDVTVTNTNMVTGSDSSVEERRARVLTLLQRRGEINERPA